MPSAPGLCASMKILRQALEFGWRRCDASAGPSGYSLRTPCLAWKLRRPAPAPWRGRPHRGDAGAFECAKRSRQIQLGGGIVRRRLRWPSGARRSGRDSDSLVPSLAIRTSHFSPASRLAAVSETCDRSRPPRCRRRSPQAICRRRQAWSLTLGMPFDCSSAARIAVLRATNQSQRLLICGRARRAGQDRRNAVRRRIAPPWRQDRMRPATGRWICACVYPRESIFDAASACRAIMPLAFDDAGG